ncbi:MAG: glycoside hydrolase family 26 protein [Endomicrobium sp.]|jgi:hypothetical protein|nr:glycoside hydrolase family 26 protein [Endomicrobium sp.]
MNKFLIAALVCLSFSSLFAREVSMTGRFVANDAQTLIFCGQNNQDSDDFVKTCGRIPAGFMVYTSLSDLSGLNSLADFGAGETSADYILKKYPKTSLQIGLYLVNALEGVAEGSFDKNIDELADYIKKAQVPVFLRIGYEFDYPDNGYEPDLYVKAYRKIVDKFDASGVKNAAFVWHSYAAMNPKGIERYYPGDEYVDWCAISYFASPQWIPMLKFSQKHNKPLMIAECSPVSDANLKESGKLDWYKKLFSFIENNNIKALCYINADWNSQPMFENYGWGNCKIDSSPEIKSFWLEKTADKRYVFLNL